MQIDHGHRGSWVAMIAGQPAPPAPAGLESEVGTAHVSQPRAAQQFWTANGPCPLPSARSFRLPRHQPSTPSASRHGCRKEHGKQVASGALPHLCCQHRHGRRDAVVQPVFHGSKAKPTAYPHRRGAAGSEGRSFGPYFGFGELCRRFRFGNGAPPPAAAENSHPAAGTPAQ